MAAGKDPAGNRRQGAEREIFQVVAEGRRRVFNRMKDFGASESPKPTRSSTTHWCPGRPGHPAFRHNIASSLRLHTGLPYDWTPRSDAPLGSPLAPSARRVSRVASRLWGLPAFASLSMAGRGSPLAAFLRYCKSSVHVVLALRAELDGVAHLVSSRLRLGHGGHRSCTPP